MRPKVCPYCGREFKPSRYHPDQKICSSPECQRRRSADYRRRKLAEDPVYRDTCSNSREKWRDKNPGYMKRYLAARRARNRIDFEESPQAGNLRALLDRLKNNVALELKSSEATIWLLCPRGLLDERNTLARAKAIVLEGFMHVIVEEKP